MPPVCLIGAVIARFRPAGMARALFVTALAEAFVLAMVLLRNLPTTAWTAAVARGFGLNAFLVVLFVVSALLFLPAFLPASLKDGAASGAV
ncbi:MAG: hypothetical protein HOP19_18950 [Acidobacteria bacterium]|nr:hypothetical protein [Acidobacteriota bacterium]